MKQYWMWNKNFTRFYVGISLLSMFTFGVVWYGEPGFSIEVGPLEVEIIWRKSHYGDEA